MSDLFDGNTALAVAPLTDMEVRRLVELEDKIDRGLHTFVAVGGALMEVRDAGLFRGSHVTFEAYCRERWGLKRQRAYELMGAAQVVNTVSEISDITPARESHAAPLAALKEPEQQKQAWAKAVATAPKDDETGEPKITAAHVERVVEEVRGAHNHRAQGTGENEWYTPAEYVEKARAVLGTIDLDPASSKRAQETVQAGRFFTAEDDGLTREWSGRVWLNPPYAQPAIHQFADKMVAEVSAGRVSEAIMLTHNYTDTAWFHLAESVADAVCFTRGRIRFVGPNGEVAAPTQGQAFFYYGPNVELFREVFGDVGFIR